MVDVESQVDTMGLIEVSSNACSGDVVWYLLCHSPLCSASVVLTEVDSGVDVEASDVEVICVLLEVPVASVDVPVTELSVTVDALALRLVLPVVASVASVVRYVVCVPDDVPASENCDALAVAGASVVTVVISSSRSVALAANKINRIMLPQSVLAAMSITQQHNLQLFVNCIFEQ